MRSRSGSRQRRTDYSATPLAQKLGIRAGCDVALVGAPEGFEETLAPLPDGVTIHARPPRRVDVVLLFATRESDLRRRFARLAERIGDAGGLWVAWPKKTSKITNDLSFDDVQRFGLDEGLVDNKSASIDADWQGLRFVVRRRDRGAG